MKIRFKIALILALGIAGVTCAAFFLSRVFFERAFAEVESSIFRDRLTVAETLFHGELAELRNAALAYAADPDFNRALMNLENPGTLSHPLRKDLARERITTLAYADDQGNVTRTVTLAEDGLLTDTPEQFDAFLAQDSYLRRHLHKESQKAGLAVLDDPMGVQLVASVPVLPPEENGLIEGTLILTRRLKDTILFQVARKSEMKLQIQIISREKPASTDTRAAAPPSESRFRMEQHAASELVGTVMLRDVYDAPAVVIRLTQPRSAYAHASGISIKVATICAIAGLASLGLCLILTEITINSRVRNLLKQVSDIEGKEDMSSAHISLPGKDELSRISHGMRYILSALKVNRFRWLRSERRLQALLDSFNAGVILVDMGTGYIKRMNTVAADMGRKKRRDLLGKPVLNYLKRESGTITLKDLRELGKSKAKSGGFVLKNDTDLPVEITPRQLDLGSEEYMALFITEVTEAQIPAEKRQ